LHHISTRKPWNHERSDFWDDLDLLRKLFDVIEEGPLEFLNQITIRTTALVDSLIYLSLDKMPLFEKPWTEGQSSHAARKRQRYKLERTKCIVPSVIYKM
jgi:hypothetical protein